MRNSHIQLLHLASMVLIPIGAVALMVWPQRVTETAAALAVLISAVSDGLALRRSRETATSPSDEEPTS